MNNQQNALAMYQGDGFDIMQRTAKAMVASGFFKDSKDVAQAVVKVMAGAELGIAPFAAMSGVHIVNGKPTLSSNLIATLVKNSGRYDYRIKVCDDKVCVLTWYENGQETGESAFTFAEAQSAGLTSKSVWKQYPSDMLFARALTRGARRFAPGIFGGAPVYTPEEVGADEDIDGMITTVSQAREVVFDAQPEPEPVSEEPEDIAFEDLPSEGKSRGIVPRDAVAVKRDLDRAANGNGKQPSDKMLTYVRASLSKAAGDNAKAKSVIKYLWGLDTSSDLTAGQCSAMIDWIGATQDNDYQPLPVAIQEIERIHTAQLKAEGQQQLI
jgi:hypothetical protein